MSEKEYNEIMEEIEYKEYLEKEEGEDLYEFVARMRNKEF